MADAQTETRRGLSRREMIRASAVAGAAAWTAPVIIDSLTSPAAAGSVVDTECISYIAFVMTCASGQQSVKFDGGSQYPNGLSCGSFAAPDCDDLDTPTCGNRESYTTGLGSDTCPVGLDSSVGTGANPTLTINLPSGCTVDDNRVWRHKGNILCKCDIFNGSQIGSTFTVTLTGVTC